ncbi:MAG: protease-like activity factor CPAF [Elusimicrobia bacterium]|nr:protease-like activity factor CPAF [Elusimicrobiota bacterium]
MKNPLYLILPALFAPAAALAVQFEVRPVDGGQIKLSEPVKVMPTIDFSRVPGLDAALRSPVTPQTIDLRMAPTVLPTAALSQEAPRAEAPAPGASLEATTQRVSADIEAAGPIQDAAPGDAAGLGGRLQSALQGRADDGIPSGATAAGQTPDQSAKLRSLKQIVSIFTEHYAPIEWKQRHRGVDFVAEYQKARAKVLAKPGMSQHEFQGILADFVASAQDYHAGISFFSTEKAGLPLMILGAGGKHYIAYVDRTKLSPAEFPYEPGDEVVSFGGQSVSALAASFTKVPNTPETDARLAEMKLTNRSRRSGAQVPQGGVELVVKTGDGKSHASKLDWNYQPELIPTDVPQRGVVLGPETDNGLASPGAPVPAPAPRPAPRSAVRQLLERFLPSMAHPMAGPFSELAAASPDNGFMIGGKKTYVPALGTVVWELPPQIAAQVPFVVKIYKDAAGRKLGYVRIPDYMGGGNTDAAAQLFEKLVEKLQAETDGLVIDQVNNPGGNMFYMNDLLSMLTDKPLAVAKHRLMIDESDAAMAAEILKQASDPGIMQEMEQVLQEMMQGFTAGPKAMLQPLVDYAHFVLSELKAGRRLTDPTYIFGVSQIEPHPTTRYTKPIVVLINELDFSAADFFAAVMQDNKRAAIFGVRTAGAGGAVKSVEIPNQYGIEHLAYTWTIAVRPGGKPIENLGVQPDEHYAITADDLRSGFAGYAKALEALIGRLLPPGSSVVVADEGPGPGPGPMRRPMRRPRSRPE